MARFPDHQQLRKDLDHIARQTVGALRRAGMRSEIARASVRFAGLLLVVPGLYAAVQVLRLLTGGSAEPMGATPLAVASLAVPGAFIMVACVRRWFRRIERRTALGVCDAELALQDRLVTADEFLDRPQNTGFMAAALEDAEAHARRARDARFQVSSPLPRFRPWSVLAAASLFVLSLLLASVQVEGAILPAGAETAPVTVEIAGEKATLGEVDRDRTAGDGETQTPDRRTGPGEGGGSLPGLQQSLEGATGGGGASAAGFPGEPTPAAGSPTDGGPPSRGTGTGQPRSPEQARTRAGTLGAARPADESGSGMGNGSARGASDNPMSGDRDSRQVGAGEDRDLEDDAEVQGETEDQEARGGVQPNLRDRRPSASRELQIGFGSDVNPDANGRGGPSEPKKSRGVASLVLGVPIPDLIAGQPNPGRTVVTRERIRPDREDAGVTTAGFRTPRSAPMGYVPHPELTQWMRNLVRTYFLTMRSEGSGQERQR